MRISDWSSDVCSSDLIDYLAGAQEQLTIGVLPPSPPALPEKATVSMSEAVNQSQITFDDEKMLTDLERVMRGKIFGRSEEHTSELQSLMRISYAVFCLKKKNTRPTYNNSHTSPMSNSSRTQITT